MRRIILLLIISCIWGESLYSHSLTKAKVHPANSGGSGGDVPCFICYDNPEEEYVELKITPSHYPFKVKSSSLRNSSARGMNIYFNNSALPSSKSLEIHIVKNGNKYPNQKITHNSNLLTNGQLTIRIKFKARYCINSLLYSHQGDRFFIASNITIENFSPNNGNSIGSNVFTTIAKAIRFLNCNGTLPYELMISSSLSKRNKNSIQDETPFIYNVYPNPAVKYILINFKILDKTKIKFNLFNQLGKPIRYLERSNYYTPNNSIIKYDLSKIPKGIYYLNVEVYGRKYVKKIIKS